jgi:hypothetical protein
MALNAGIKWKVLSVADKMDIIKKVGTQPHITLIKLVEDVKYQFLH